MIRPADCARASTTAASATTPRSSTIEPTTGQVIVYAPNRDPTQHHGPAGSRGHRSARSRSTSRGRRSSRPCTWPGSTTSPRTPMSTHLGHEPADQSKARAITRPPADGGNEGLITARGRARRVAERARLPRGLRRSVSITSSRWRRSSALPRSTRASTRRSTPIRTITYGASIATGGANVRAIDMAYMNATIANMGMMVGVPTLAQTVPLDPDARAFRSTTGADYDTA